VNAQTSDGRAVWDVAQGKMQGLLSSHGASSAKGECATGGTQASSTKRKRGNALHEAILRADWVACRALIRGAEGKQLMRERNSGGSTAMIMAANGQCGEMTNELVELMLEHGAAETLGVRRLSKTAADYATEQNNHTLAKRLEELASKLSDHEADMSSQGKLTAVMRCHCGEELKRRSRLDFLTDRVRHGQEQNTLVRALYEQSPGIIGSTVIRVSARS